LNAFATSELCLHTSMGLFLFSQAWIYNTKMLWDMYKSVRDHDPCRCIDFTRWDLVGPTALTIAVVVPGYWYLLRKGIEEDKTNRARKLVDDQRSDIEKARQLVRIEEAEEFVMQE
jgi:hypothetical protein